MRYGNKETSCLILVLFFNLARHIFQNIISTLYIYIKARQLRGLRSKWDYLLF
ncbi:unnamed protein product [Arabidopsis halleri]